MNPRVKDVKPNPDYALTLIFTNGEVEIFDVKPHLQRADAEGGDEMTSDIRNTR